MEYKVILAVILMVIVISVIVTIAILPGFVYGKESSTQVSFREFCIFWSLNGYYEGYGQPVERKGVLYGCPAGCNPTVPPFLKNYCPDAVGKIFETLSMKEIREAIEDCRNICRLQS